MIIEYILVKEKTELCSDKATFSKLLKTNPELHINYNRINYSDKEAIIELDCEDSEDRNKTIFYLDLLSDKEADGALQI